MHIARLRVYLAGPYSKGDVEANVASAIDAWHTLHDLGFSPFCPHLTHYLHLRKPLDYEACMTWDFEWLSQCEAVYRLPGESPGADRESRFAEDRGIPVFTSIKKLAEFFQEP